MALPTANNVNHPVCWGYGASLDNKGGDPTDKLYLRLADSPDRVSGIQMVEPAELPKMVANPEDIRAESGSIFSRSQFSGGEGLDRAHRRQGDQDFDAARFWNSRGIKITPAHPGYPEELTLLRETGSVATSANTSWLTRIGSVLYWADGMDVKRTANGTASSPTISSEDPEAGGTPTTISGLAVLGDELYAALGAEGIHKRDSAGVWAHWSDLDCSGGRVWSVKGRILAASGTTLYEAGSLATSVALKTLPSGQSWNDVIDAGSVVIAAASDGNLYMWAEQDGELVLAGQEDFEGGEIPYELGMTQGVLFVGTGQLTTAAGKIGRLWIAEVVGQKIRNAQVIRQWGSGTTGRDQTPGSFCATRDSMFFVAHDADSVNVWYMWRFHLATAGLTSDIAVLSGSGQTRRGVVVLDDRLFASMGGTGVYRELTTYTSTGYLISPLVDLYTAQPKVWVGARMDAQIPVTQETIVLAYSTNPDAILDSGHASWTTLITYNNATTQDVIDAEVALSAVKSRYIAIKITLTASTDKTTAPTVYSYAVRALPVPTDELLRLFVNVSDQVIMPFRKTFAVPGQGRRIWEELRDNWKGRNVEAEIFRPSIKVRGQIVGMSTPIQGRLPTGAVQVYAILDIQGVKVA